MKIAVLYTCFNRKDKTLSSLKGLYEAVCTYNKQSKEKIEPIVYLTDDGCTDGTAEAIRTSFSDKEIHILQGTGSMFWAGGMRYAWKEALKRHEEWDFYLLLNDDTDLFVDCMIELINTHSYCINTYNINGIYSGITCAKTDHSKITYGGDVFTNKLLGKYYRLKPCGTPQKVDMCNANILMVHKSVVDKIGIFYEGYIHGFADNDFGIIANKKGIPVLVTSKLCGSCEHDHDSLAEFQEKILSMDRKMRKKFFEHPLHSNKDSLTFTKRTFPAKYPLAWIFRWLNINMPQLYYKLNKIRNK